MIRIFIDFDGTISLQDVGDVMFETFGGETSKRAVEDYRLGKISAIECFRRECAACGEVDTQTLNAFLDSQEIDSTFLPFTEFCRSHEFKYCVVSDGMDYYIHRILQHHGVGEVPFLSNTLSLMSVEGSMSVRFMPSFPYTDEVCDRCASCKRNHMLTMCADDDIIVYIGEGYSDRCPARYSDIVFAKDDLLKYCRQENISCYEYNTFADIQSRLQSLLEQQRSGNPSPFKKRKQAELARQEVYMGG